MARSNEGTRKKRSDLESAMLALVEVENRLPLITLRVEQAIRRAGLYALLEPALDDLAHAASAAHEARVQVAQVASQYEER